MGVFAMSDAFPVVAVFLAKQNDLWDHSGNGSGLTGWTPGVSVSH